MSRSIAARFAHSMLLLALLVLGVILATDVLAEGAPPPGGASILPAGVFAGLELAGPEGAASAKQEAVSGQSFQQALRLDVTQVPEKRYQIALRAKTTAKVAKGDVCLLSFAVREAGKGTLDEQVALVTAFVEKAGKPWDKSLNYTVRVGKEWTRVDLPFVWQADYPAGEAQLGLAVGHKAQTLEIADVKLLNYGKKIKLADLPRYRASYPGRHLEAPWREGAAKRIDKHRKGDLAVVVTDQLGQPLKGVTVKVEMTRHAFGFGAAVTAYLLTEDSADGRRYRKIVEDWFSKVVFENDLKWGPWQLGQTVPKEHRFSMHRKNEAIKWLHQRKIPIRGHWLCHNVLDRIPPAEKLAGQPDKLLSAIKTHVDAEARTLRGRIAEWDAINHLVGWGKSTSDVIGEDGLVEVLRAARAADPNAAIYVNEGQVLTGGKELADTRREAYSQRIQRLLKAGAPIDGIGFMGHFTEGNLTGMEKVYAILDDYAKLNRRLQITELDVDSTDEDLQADYYRDILTIAFSHPKVDGVVMWGFWAGKHWKPNAALINKDWTLKPAGTAWRNLVLGTWWTRDTLVTDAAGKAGVRGFLGSYRVTVRGSGGATKTVEVELPSVGKTVYIQMD